MSDKRPSLSELPKAILHITSDKLGQAYRTFPSFQGVVNDAMNDSLYKRSVQKKDLRAVQRIVVLKISSCYGTFYSNSSRLSMESEPK